MPLSAARQSANAANAQHSTGPRTPDGKTRSAQNARKHGLTAQHFVIGPEEREEFETFADGLHADVAPRGALQQSLFDELAGAAWNLRRIRRMETELCSHAAAYLDLLNDDDLQAKLDRLARHRSRIECTFHRNLKELKSLQTSAAIRTLIPQHIRESAPPLASAIEIAKRSQARFAEPAAQIPLEPICLQWTDPDAAATANLSEDEPEKQLTATSAA